jgi:5'-nucleotidase
MTKILVCNDDGYSARGIQTLNEILRLESFDTTVVAPSVERSTTGHSLTLDHPLRLEEVGDQIYSCSGFPADCTLLGLGHVMKDDRPEVVVSGINRGANLSQDMYYSGTMAAAREACFHGVPSIAVSLDCGFSADTRAWHYETAANVIVKLLQAKVYKLLPEKCMINVNVPNVNWSDLQGMKIGPLGFRNYNEQIQEKTDGRGRKYFWIVGSLEGMQDFGGISDTELVRQNYVSITTLATMGQVVDWTEVHSAINEVRL